jgi:hypothetical protein
MRETNQEGEEEEEEEQKSAQRVQAAQRRWDGRRHYLTETDGGPGSLPFFLLLPIFRQNAKVKNSNFEYHVIFGGFQSP